MLQKKLVLKPDKLNTHWVFNRNVQVINSKVPKEKEKRS